MATDYGLLSGMAQGIREGLLAYQTTRKIQNDQQTSDLLHGIQRDENGNPSFTPMQQQVNEAKQKSLLTQYGQTARQNKIQNMTQGIQEDDQGNVSFTPEAQEQNQMKRQADIATNKGVLAEHDPTSDESETLRQFAKQNGVKGITDSMPGSQVREMLPVAIQGIKSDEMLKAVALKGQMGAGKADQKELQHDQDKLFADKDFIAANTGLASGKKLKDMIQQNNPIEANMAKVYLARMAVGGGRINQQEIQAAGGSKAFIDKANQLVDTYVDGTISPQNKQYMMQLIDTSMKSDAQNKQDAVDKFAQRRAHNKGTDIDSEYENLTGASRPQGLLKNKTGGPKVGDIEGGYRFKGGDPANQSNWEKQ